MRTRVGEITLDNCLDIDQLDSYFEQNIL